MSSRIGTAFASQQAVDAMNRRSQSAARLQEQIATGRRISTASDDPAGAAEAERLRSSNARSASERRMMQFAQSALGRADGALGSGTDVLQSARDLLIQANNASYSTEQRSAISTQLQGIRDELMSLANQSDGTGSFVFGGKGSSTAPFATPNAADPAAAPPAGPPAGTRQTGTDMQFDLSVDGGQVFLGDRSATARGSIFAALDKVIGQLKDPAQAAAVPANVGEAMNAVDATLGRFSAARTSVGEQMRAIESRTRLLESGELETTSRMSALTDTDYAQALSDVSQTQMASQAAMRTYAQISRLSLFDYL